MGRTNLFSIFASLLIVMGCSRTPKPDMQPRDLYYVQQNLEANFYSLRLPADTIRLQKENGDSLFLIDLLNDKPKTLFLVYSEINCRTCVETVLNLIHKEHSKIADNMVVVSRYQSLRNLYAFKRVNSYEGPIYNDYNNTMLSRFNTKWLPALFFIDNNGTVHQYLWADKSHVETLKKYLKIIEKQL